MRPVANGLAAQETDGGESAGLSQMRTKLFFELTRIARRSGGSGPQSGPSLWVAKADMGYSRL